MKVDRKELIKALKMTKGFTDGKSFPVIGNVLIDGPGQKIQATDFTTFAGYSINITDYRQNVSRETPEVIHPVEEDLTDLTVAQLRNLCEYAGVSAVSKKKDMVRAIFEAGAESAQTEENHWKGSLIEVDERFLVDPGLLLKLISSEKEETIELRPEEFSVNELFPSPVARVLAVGKHFQRIPLGDPDEFPELPEITEWGNAGHVSGNALMSVVDGCDFAADARPHTQIVLFDVKEEQMVSTNGSVLHTRALEFEFPCDIKLTVRGVKVLGKICKVNDCAISVTPDGEHVNFSYEGLDVVFRNEPYGFPNYVDIVEMESTHEVSVNGDVLRETVDQVLLVDEAADWTFNGNLNIEASNFDRGDFRKFDLPIVGSVEPEINIKLGAGNVQRALRYVGETAEIGLSGPESPVFFRGGDFRALVMGIRR